MIRGNKRVCHLLFSSRPPDWERGKESLLCQLCQPGGSDGKESTYNAGDPDLIPGSGRSPVEGNSNPLEYSCPENSMSLWATVHGVTESDMTEFTFTSAISHTSKDWLTKEMTSLINENQSTTKPMFVSSKALWPKDMY